MTVPRRDTKVGAKPDHRADTEPRAARARDHANSPRCDPQNRTVGVPSLVARFHAAGTRAHTVILYQLVRTTFGKGSSGEVGSIHTLQGYDLNYAGVIIGPDIEVDEHGFLRANRAHYADKRGKANVDLALEPSERQTTDDDLLRYIRNCYRVLLTRGIRGTYIYAGESTLRERIKGA